MRSSTSSLIPLALWLAACASSPGGPVETAAEPPAAVAADPVATAPAAVTPDPPAEILPGLRTREIAPGVWIHVSSQLFAGRPFDSNGLVLLADGEAFLVDTAWGAEATHELLEWIDARGARLVGAVVTHGHADRGGGTALLRERGVPVWARGDTARWLTEQGLGTPDQRVATTGATRLFDGRLEVYYPGPGHTADNVVVYLPRQDILFGGCFLRALGSTSLGNLSDAVVEEWAASAERVGEQFPRVQTVIPGHGDPAGAEIIAHTIELAEAGS